MTGEKTNFRFLLVAFSIQRNAYSSVILSVVEESSLIKYIIDNIILNLFVVPKELHPYPFGE